MLSNVCILVVVCSVLFCVLAVLVVCSAQQPKQTELKLRKRAKKQKLKNPNSSRPRVPAAAAKPKSRIDYKKVLADRIAAGVHTLTPSKSTKKIPVFITTHNRFWCLEACLRSLKRFDSLVPVIVDNASSYPPMLGYLSALMAQKVEVLKYPKNDLFGNMKLAFQNYTNAHKGEFDYYIFTDPDIELPREIPNDFVDVLKALVDTFPEFDGVGPNLITDDIPEEYPLRHLIVEDESTNQHDLAPEGFHAARVEESNLFVKFAARRIRIQSCDIDTTFMMHRANLFRKERNVRNAIRIAKPYAARHLDWYVIPGNETSDQKHYVNSRNNFVSHWGFSSDNSDILVLSKCAYSSKPGKNGIRHPCNEKLMQGDPTKISLLLPTFGRSKSLDNALKNIQMNTNDISLVEVLIGIDSTDKDFRRNTKIAQNYRFANVIKREIVPVNRNDGYDQLCKLFTQMASRASGGVLGLWGDRCAFMKGWDDLIRNAVHKAPHSFIYLKEKGTWNFAHPFVPSVVHNALPQGAFNSYSDAFMREIAEEVGGVHVVDTPKPMVIRLEIKNMEWQGATNKGKGDTYCYKGKRGDGSQCSTEDLDLMRASVDAYRALVRTGRGFRASNDALEHGTCSVSHQDQLIRVHTPYDTTDFNKGFEEAGVNYFDLSNHIRDTYTTFAIWRNPIKRSDDLNYACGTLSECTNVRDPNLKPLSEILWGIRIDELIDLDMDVDDVDKDNHAEKIVENQILQKVFADDYALFDRVNKQKDKKRQVRILSKIEPGLP
tara:strand:+ start:42231 stop:44549 length:2319 start_codon:yes stop_codon:yes gene_type:complete